MCTCILMHMNAHICHGMHGASGVNLRELVLSFHHWGFGDRIQVVRLGDVCLYPLSCRVREGKPICPFTSMWLSIF